MQQNVLEDVDNKKVSLELLEDEIMKSQKEETIEIEPDVDEKEFLEEFFYGEQLKNRAKDIFDNKKSNPNGDKAVVFVVNKDRKVMSYQIKINKESKTLNDVKDGYRALVRLCALNSDNGSGIACRIIMPDKKDNNVEYEVPKEQDEGVVNFDMSWIPRSVCNDSHDDRTVRDEDLLKIDATEGGKFNLKSDKFKDKEIKDFQVRTMIDGMANNECIGIRFSSPVFEGSDKNQFIRVKEITLSSSEKYKSLCISHSKLEKSGSSAKLPVYSEFMADRKAKAKAEATKAAKAAFLPWWAVALISFLVPPSSLFLIPAKIYCSDKAYNNVMSEYNKSNKNNGEPRKEHEKNIDDK